MCVRVRVCVCACRVLSVLWVAVRCGVSFLGASRTSMWLTGGGRGTPAAPNTSLDDLRRMQIASLLQARLPLGYPIPLP